MPIYLNATAAAPDLSTLFRAWLANTPIPQINPSTLFDATKSLLHQLPLADLPATGLLLATTKGDIQSTIQWIRSQDTSPTSDPPPILSNFAHHLAASAGLAGPTYTLSTACSSGLTALIDSAHHLLDHTAQHMVAIACDAATDFVQDGFTALKALSPTTCKPFDKNRDGLSLGSAAAAALLSLTPAQNPLAILSGWALASDATHMTAPDRHANGLIRAIHSALAMANLKPHDIDVILAHGTGTRYNDAMEITAIDSVFTHAPCPHRPAITAVKGLIGHTLGASGLLESALACEILRLQTIPPITNLQYPESSELNLMTATPRKAPIRHILKLAAGFGGLNAAVILSHPHPVTSPAACSGATPPLLQPPATLPRLEPKITRAVTHLGPFIPPSTHLTSPDPLASLLLNLAHPLLSNIPHAQRANTALVLGTTRGCLAADIEFDRSRRTDNARYASPAAFARTLPSTLAAELSVKLTLHGPILTLIAGNSSSHLALDRAASLMRHLSLTRCLVVTCDASPEPSPVHFRAAVLLLEMIETGTPLPHIAQPLDLCSSHDASLDTLIEWINNRPQITG